MTIYFELEGVLIKKQKELEWIPGSNLLYSEVSAFTQRVGWKVKVFVKYYSEIDKKNKVSWVKENLGLTNKSIKLIPDLKYIVKYADPLSILIGETQDRIRTFIYSGGIGILYDGLAKTVKKLEYLIEAMDELYKEKPDKINDAYEILKKRLEYILKKIDPENWKFEYEDCFDSAYDRAKDFTDTMQEAVTTDWNIKLKKQFESIYFLAVEQELKNEEESNLMDSSNISFDTFPKIDFDNFNKWEKILYEFYDKTYFMLEPKLTFLPRASYHLAKNSNISNLFLIDSYDAESVLMFVYLTTLINVLEENLVLESMQQPQNFSGASIHFVRTILSDRGSSSSRCTFLPERRAQSCDRFRGLR